MSHGALLELFLLLRAKSNDPMPLCQHGQAGLLPGVALGYVTPAHVAGGGGGSPYLKNAKAW
jgi:hypothetical protein